MKWNTRICGLLGIEHPILEGAIGILANGKLAGAVSEAGALGVIAGTQVGLLRSITWII